MHPRTNVQHFISSFLITGLMLIAPALNAKAVESPWIIGVEDAASPWSSADGTGYANDIVIAALQATGTLDRLQAEWAVRALTVESQ